MARRPAKNFGLAQPKITAELMAADHAAIWAAMGGIGDPPPLMVPPGVYKMAIEAGYPAEKMNVYQRYGMRANNLHK